MGTWEATESFETVLRTLQMAEKAVSAEMDSKKCCRILSKLIIRKEVMKL